MDTDEKIKKQLKDKQKNLTITVVVIILIAAAYLYTKNNNISLFAPTHPKIVAAKTPEISPLPTDGSTLTGDAKKAYDERKMWTTVSINNQPTLGANAQSFSLPNGWSAREDYLLTVVPITLPPQIKNYRSVIFRPLKPLSREDAIFTSPDITNSYFNGHCHATVGKAGVCYGGKNPETKHVFDLMFFFQSN